MSTPIANLLRGDIARAELFGRMLKAALATRKNALLKPSKAGYALKRGLAAVGLVTLLGLVQPASAAIYTVTLTTDGNGACTGTVCPTLRAAVSAANATAVADTIVLNSATYTLSIPGVNENANLTGDLDVKYPLTITGTGVASTIINGNQIDRVFDVMAGASLTLSGVTVTGGSSINNVFECGGGGVQNAGTLTINDSAISGNKTLRLGGGIANNGGTLIINRSTIGNNTAAQQGGGIRDCNGGSMSITASTISGNAANQGSGQGGGIFTEGGTTTLSNTTVSGNIATAWGGIAVTYGNVMTIGNSTISANISPGLGVGLENLNGTVKIKNSIIADQAGTGANTNCGGAIVSLGGNLSNTTACGYVAALGDVISPSALLGPLTNNGGPTQTMLPSSGSPAIDALVTPANCLDPSGVLVSTDQRAVSRPQGVACDIGAVEVALPPPTYRCSGPIGHVIDVGYEQVKTTTSVYGGPGPQGGGFGGRFDPTPVLTVPLVTLVSGECLDAHLSALPGSKMTFGGVSRDAVFQVTLYNLTTNTYYPMIGHTPWPYNFGVSGSSPAVLMEAESVADMFSANFFRSVGSPLSGSVPPGNYRVDVWWAGGPPGAPGGAIASAFVLKLYKQ
jgi:hypothetical protein